MPPLKAGPTGVIKQLQKYKPWPARMWESTQGIKVTVHDLLLVLFFEKPHLAGAGNMMPLWSGPVFLSNGCNCNRGSFTGRAGGCRQGRQRSRRAPCDLSGDWGEQGQGIAARTTGCCRQVRGRGSSSAQTQKAAWPHLQWLLDAACLGLISFASLTLVCCCETRGLTFYSNLKEGEIEEKCS